MRVSTLGLANDAVNILLRQQATLARTQNQVATGKRINEPSDDPIGAVQALGLQQALAQSDQFSRNSDVAKNRLTLEEQALSDIGSLLQRVHELTVQAGNTGSLSDSDRQAIATELRSRTQELVDAANRKDGAGEYLFSGFATTTQPFARTAAGSVTYSGDQGARLLQVSTSQKVADSDTGFATFLNVVEGNGTFATKSNAANTGSGVIDVGTVTNKSAWVPDTYTLTFLTPTTYQITDASAAVVATGNYTSASAIAFRGVQVSVTGTPDANDSFTVSTAGKKDMFTMLDDLVAALDKPSSSSAGRAQLATQVGTTLQQLDVAESHLLGTRAAVGSRLAALDDADAARETQSVDLKTAISSLQDLDYASALTKLSQQMLGLQAAQQSYSRIAQLSLFNYL